tara:strand:+ start:19525 stop:19653 length:129 start_codon:yes stop_codon:yes gene_type:complete
VKEEDGKPVKLREEKQSYFVISNPSEVSEKCLPVVHTSFFSS